MTCSLFLMGLRGSQSLTSQYWGALPENQRNLYAVINGIGTMPSSDVISDLDGAFVDPSLVFTTQDVASFVSNALNTESEFYNASFADSVVQNLIRPTFSLGYDSNTVAETGDINESGDFTSQDIISFGTLANTQYGQTLSFSGFDFSVNVPLPEQFSLPGGTLDALQTIAEMTSGASLSRGFRSVILRSILRVTQSHANNRI